MDAPYRSFDSRREEFERDVKHAKRSVRKQLRLDLYSRQAKLEGELAALRMADLAREHDMYDLQQQKLAPVTATVRTILRSYAVEMSYVAVFDAASHKPSLPDITVEVIGPVNSATADAAPQH
jgi:hypothetical protein